MPNLKNPMVPQELLVVGAALKTGIFDVLREKPHHLEGLAGALSLDQRALWVVLEALLSQGYLAKEGDQYRLTKEAQEILFDETSEQFIGYSLIHTFNVIKSWSQIPQVLKTGAPAERERDEQDIKGFMAAMKKNARQIADQLTAICLKDLPREPRVLDLGGGPLNYARPFAKNGAHVTVQDMPEVCKVMEPTLEPGENIKFVPGDFTESIAEGPFDLAFLGNICHIYGQEENTLLFTRVHKVLVSGGRIAIMDFVRGISPRAELFGVNMLVNTKTGGTWTLQQYTQWLNQAYFGQVQVHTMGDRQVITAQRE
ncbi:MAG: methyltransferase [Bacillota bacterium]